MKKTSELDIRGTVVRVIKINGEDFVCLTDMAKLRSEDPSFTINHWMRARMTIEYLGLWETLYNPDFNPTEFGRVREDSGLNTFVLSPTKWITATNAIGLGAPSGRYGGTYARSENWQRSTIASTRTRSRRTIMNQRIERNRETMRLFEKCINTNDLELGNKLISAKAAFKTPVSPEPLMGAEGYLSVVTMMKASFPDVQWKLEDMVADEHTVAVQWTCSGTFTGSQPFAGIQPNGRKFSTTVMNFYKFDDDGLIIDDVAGVGIAGILQGIGAIK